MKLSAVKELKEQIETKAAQIEALRGLGIEFFETLCQAEEKHWRLYKIDCYNNCGVIALTLFFSTPPPKFYDYNL